ncbi:putative small EDRK-rich factor [Helianthus debilis subsp. tardiflorus]
MTRGNQREKDRERAHARSGGKAKNKDDGLTPEQRRESLRMEKPFKRRLPRKQHRRQRVAVMLEVIKAPRNNTTS